MNNLSLLCFLVNNLTFVSVIFEIIDKDGHRTAEHLNLETPNVNSPLKNIIVLVHQNQPDPRIDVYIDCVYQGMMPLRKSFRKLADSEDNSLVEAVSFVL